MGFELSIGAASEIITPPDLGGGALRLDKLAALGHSGISRCGTQYHVVGFCAYEQRVLKAGTGQPDLALSVRPPIDASDVLTY